MNDVYEISMLLDFYGELLTVRQREALEQYYNCDLSFGEIAENSDISRQGVYDNIKRGKSTLFKLEEKLGLVKKFLEIKQQLKQIDDILQRVSVDDSNAVEIYIEHAKKLLYGVIMKY